MRKYFFPCSQFSREENRGWSEPLIFEQTKRATSGGLKFKRFQGLFGLAFEGPLRDKCVFRSFILIITTGPPFPRPFSSKERRKRWCTHIFFCPRRCSSLGDFAMKVRSQISFCRDQQRRYSFPLFSSFGALSVLLRHHYRPFVFLPGTRFGPIEMGPARARPAKTIAFLILLGPDTATGRFRPWILRSCVEIKFCILKFI